MGAVDTQIAEGDLTVDASDMSVNDQILTFNGSASETDGFEHHGGVGADTITGAANNDTISGGLAADSITGGLGADSITGGGGSDVMVYSAVAQSNSSNTDTITDFTTTEDVLKVTLIIQHLPRARPLMQLWLPQLQVLLLCRTHYLVSVVSTSTTPLTASFM